MLTHRGCLSAMTVLACAAAALAHPENYFLTVAPATSSSTFSFTVTAPFLTTPSGVSNLIGNYNVTTNPTGTRTKPGFSAPGATENVAVPITGGNANMSAGNNASPSHPAGAFTLMLNVPGGACAIAGLHLDLLNGAPISFNPAASVTYVLFTERNPSGIVPGATISVPLGAAQITSVLAAQVDPANPGTLTPAGPPNQYNFSVPMSLTVTTSVTLAGSPVPIDPQVIPVTVTGSVMISGDTAIGSAVANITSSQTQPGPTPMAPMAFTEPLWGGNLIANISLASTTVQVTSNNSVSDTGVKSRIADVATGGAGAAIPDGFITGEDFDLFVQAFYTLQTDAAGRLIADVATAGTGAFEPDGFVTGEDFDAFVVAYYKGL